MHLGRNAACPPHTSAPLYQAARELKARSFTPALLQLFPAPSGPSPRQAVAATAAVAAPPAAHRRAERKRRPYGQEPSSGSRSQLVRVPEAAAARLA